VGATPEGDVVVHAYMLDNTSEERALQLNCQFFSDKLNALVNRTCARRRICICRDPHLLLLDVHASFTEQLQCQALGVRTYARVLIDMHVSSLEGHNIFLMGKSNAPALRSLAMYGRGIGESWCQLDCVTDKNTQHSTQHCTLWKGDVDRSQFKPGK
jgi:hypothetical protein